MNVAAWSDTLQCRWRRWEVVGPTTLRVWLPPQNCTDMMGAIRTATMLLPDVRRIETYVNAQPDSAYVRVGDTWESQPA